MCRPAAPGSVPSGPAIPKEEFDFNAMLAKFKKDDIVKVRRLWRDRVYLACRGM